jgi:hypothetical protein
MFLAAQGIPSGPLWDRVASSLISLDGTEHRAAFQVKTLKMTNAPTILDAWDELDAYIDDPYFICLGRHQKTTNCTQRAMLISKVEEKVEEEYRGQQLDPELRDQIEAMLSEELSSLRRSAETENRRLRTQKERLTNERARLLQAHYADAIPVDLLKTEQNRISRQLAKIEARLAATNVEFEKIETCLRKALDYAVNCGDTYLRSRPQERRLMNQAFFKRIKLHDEEVQSELSEPFRTLLSDEVADDARRRADTHHLEEPDQTPSPTNVLEKNNARAAATIKVRVNKPYRVIHKGKVFLEGQVLTVPDDDEHSRWLTAGWVTKVIGK